jgi:DNA repair protein RadD
MIRQKRLCPVVAKATGVQPDVTGVGTRGGEFIPGELERAVDVADVTAAAVREIVQLGATRRAWLCFCAGVQHAEHVRDEMRRHGTACAMVTGDTPHDERVKIYSAFKEGRLRAVTNVNCWTTGFDYPGVDLIAMLRPTKSVGLYVQSIGRGMRASDGKTDCLVLDFAGNTLRHGPIDRVDGRKRPTHGGEAPVKTCPSCRSIIFTGFRTCPDCGFEFPPAALRIETTAASAPLLSTQGPVSSWVRVTNVSYGRHNKAGKPSSIRATYRCGINVYSEWICLEHEGYARQKAYSWWAKRAPGTPIPSTVDEALERTGVLRQPSEICLQRNGQYVNVVEARF